VQRLLPGPVDTPRFAGLMSRCWTPRSSSTSSDWIKSPPQRWRNRGYRALSGENFGKRLPGIGHEKALTPTHAEPTGIRDDPIAPNLFQDAHLAQ